MESSCTASNIETQTTSRYLIACLTAATIVFYGLRNSDTPVVMRTQILE
jgi:hypothetical protein